ncbi:PIG-L family deacetylase [Aliarcobacter cryaerophilus]|uniref:PIG-L deacetylase family protein n=1 Tax=Aliarcobacter cryaerophilus TaxID=28198 RepID=UPI0021B6E1B8|nr:PIG-L family deacetylase [Aliarcobacter cryaerophilus]MCT7486732.1 PIG-L family deacetylase [Aliarcobacter cryaerophilus]MCT7490797.1 PIG-L family deacetylase [Aliarcobacter cryaerophilus]
MKNKVLIVAVHPDDETLGCGGTLLKHKANGDEIHWLICTTIDKSHNYYETREKEIERVSKLYNFDSVHNLRLKTMQVDEYNMSELVGKISKVINEVQPNIIYLPFKGDVHSDHRKIFEASYSCTKSFRYPFIKKIYMIETLSETEFAPSTKEDSFIPNVFVDISGFMDKKLEIMKAFKSEIAPHPFPRSERNLKALSTLRGATCGCEYAESFVLLKEIQ